jgi:hypothetical protein
MIVALDFDGTFTEDPEGWSGVIALFKARGHTIYIVTMRHPEVEEAIPNFIKHIVDDIFYTGRLAKRKFMESKGIKIDVWIDDNPEAVSMNAEQIWPTVFPLGQTEGLKK